MALSSIHLLSHIHVLDIDNHKIIVGDLSHTVDWNSHQRLMAFKVSALWNQYILIDCHIQVYGILQTFGKMGATSSDART